MCNDIQKKSNELRVTLNFFLGTKFYRLLSLLNILKFTYVIAILKNIFYLESGVIIINNSITLFNVEQQ